MVGSYPPTQTQNLKYVPSPTHLAEDSQSPLNPTYSQNVLHHIDGVDAISRRKQVNPSSLAGENTTNPGSYIGELDEFEWHLAMIDILPMEMKVYKTAELNGADYKAGYKIDDEVSNVFAEQNKTKPGPEQSIGLFRKKGNENFTKVLAITEDLQHCKDLQHEALSVQEPLDTLQATLQNTNSGN